MQVAAYKHRPTARIARGINMAAEQADPGA